MRNSELRVKAEQELIFTERTYISNLTTMVDVFLAPLRIWFGKVRAQQ
jgi:hypothetical protein